MDVYEQMKVFGIGLSKTATKSLSEGLGMLGLNSVHCPFDDNAYAQILKGNFDLDVFKRFDAVADIPCALCFAQLDVLYPNAKFVLTQRERKSWLDSCEEHFTKRNPNKRSELLRVAVYGCGKFNRDRFDWVYDNYVASVRRHFDGRQDKLLELNIIAGEGWAKLCRFLDSPEPKRGFPRIKNPRQFTQARKK